MASEARASGFWRRYLPVQYRLIRLLDPLVRVWWRAWGLGNVVELRVVGRRTGKPRPVLLGLLRADGGFFLGHPNGEVAWTRNLAAAGGGDLSLHWPATVPIRATRLELGSSRRDAAIRATGQHVFPGNLIYRLARRHIRAVGVYFEVVLEPATERGR